MAGTVQAAGGVGPVVDLLGLLGGKKSTVSSSADTAGLQAVLAQTLGARDNSALLQSIFTQAASGIPQMQARLSNAVGARPGNNAAVATALQQSLQNTTLAAQQQLAQQELARQQVAASAGGALAQATRGTTATEGTNLGKAAGILGLLAAGDKVLNSKTGQKVVNSVGDWFSGLGDSLTGPSIGDNVNAMTLDSGVADSSVVDAIGQMWNADQWNLPEISPDFGFDFADGGAVRTRSSGGRTGSGASYTPKAAEGTGVSYQNAGMLDDLLKAQQGSSGPDQSRKFAEDAPSVPLSKVLQMSLLAMTNPVAFLASGLDLATAKPAGQFGFSDALGLVSGNPVAQLQAAATAVNTAGKSAWQNSLYGTTGSSGVAPGYTDAEEAAAREEANGAYGERGGGNASGTDMATGGAVRGPGTSTSDSIPANLSNGEYVIRADVVKRLGVDFFDQLQAEFGRSK